MISTIETPEASIEVPRAIVAIDRDGTLIEDVKGNHDDPKNFRFKSYIPDAISLLKKYKCLVVMVTNQPCISLGQATAEQVNAMNKEICDAISCWEYQDHTFDAVFVCPHSEEDNCRCRKPKTLLLADAAALALHRRIHYIDLRDNLYVIGDSWRDSQMAYDAGWTFLKAGGKASLWELAKWIVVDIDQRDVRREMNGESRYL